MEMKIRILIVDDHIVVRLGLHTLIRSQSDMQVAGEATNVHDAVALFKDIGADVVLLDLRMPGGGGVEALRRMHAIDSNVRALILSSFGCEEEIYQALQADARGYILKDTGSDELLRAIRDVHNGRRCIPPGVAARYADRTHHPELTAREMDVLRCVFRGATNKEIAYELGVAESTVKNHINNLMCKLDARDRTHAARIALQRGLLHVDG